MVTEFSENSFMYNQINGLWQVVFPTTWDDIRKCLSQEGIVMAIITISRQTASLGDDIAKSVAETLQYTFIDKMQISDVLEKHGLPAADFDKFDGKKPTIWQSMSIQKDRFIYLLGAAVYGFATSGDVVILGRGGQVLLKDVPGVLHVRIVAPFEVRMQRLMATEGCDEKKAAKLLARNDRDSSGYIRAFFDNDWDDENLYDLVLNTRTMSADTAMSLIHAMISAREFSKTPGDASVGLEDMALEETIKGLLVGVSGIELGNVAVTKGVVVLNGLANSDEDARTCQHIVSNISGVKEIRESLQIVPYPGR